MSLQLPVHLAVNYKSASQIARVTTEAWVKTNLFCPNCGGSLSLCPTGARTIDFDCLSCEEHFQLKSFVKEIKGKLLGAEYSTTLRSIKEGRHPSLILLRYLRTNMVVLNVQFVHRACITTSCLVPRRPLAATARRAGWQGCIFLLDQTPASAKVEVVRDGTFVPRPEVLKKWQTIQQIIKFPTASRGWTADVLRIVERLPQRFTLAEVYAFESELAILHRGNQHIRPKIRQQLQVLRDLKVLVFSGRGEYERVNLS